MHSCAQFWYKMVHCGIWDSCLLWCFTTREINTKITLEWELKQFVTRVHTLYYFLHNIRIHKWRWRQRSSHIASVSSLCSSRCAADVTIDCWWRYNYPTIVRRVREEWSLTRFYSLQYSQLVVYDLYVDNILLPITQAFVTYWVILILIDSLMQAYRAS